MNQLFPTVILKGRFPYKWAFAFLFFFPLSNALHGQAYKEMMNDPSINFYDVVDAAEQYFETHPKGKGSGWKGYQRWKNENEYKYYPSGDRSNVDPYFAAHQYQNFIEQSDVAQRSANNGWLDLGPYSIDSITRHYAAGLGRVEDLYVDPNNDQRIYLGSRSGGFWRSLDGGQSWEGSTTDFLPASGVNAITAVPGNPDSVLINVRNAQNGTSHGVYQSLDGGLSWNPTPFNPSNLGQGGLGTNFAINQIKYHPFVSERVLVSANNGLYRSEDNLATWTKVLGGSISEIEFHPTNPDIMYVYDYSNGGNKNVVLRSLDGGLNFTPSNTLDGNNNNTSVKMSVSPVCADCIYFASGNGIWKSENNGLDFTFISNPSSGSQGFVVNDQDTTRMLYGYLDAYASQDGGNSFEQVTWWSFGSVSFTSGKYIHADLRVAYSINGVYYVGTDGLICKSSDNGYTWEILTDDNGIRENYNLGLSQSNHFRTICGSQDNGTSIRHRGVWLEFYGADGMEGLIHPLNDDWMLGSWQYGGRLRTKNGGQTVQTVTPPGQDGNWIAPLVYDPNDHMRIYSFGTIVHRSDAFGTGWTDLGDPGFGDNIAFATIAENNSDILVVARGSAIKKSVDGGMTFTDIKSNLPNYSITDVVCDPNDDNTILVTYGRHQNDGSKVFVTHNGGTSWQNITYNLGNMPIRSIVVDHTDASNIYLGAEIGVYTMPMEGDTWVQFGSDMPNVAVREMEIMYGSNTLRAATWGRGLWEHPLVDRADYPKILYTDISSEVDTDSPKYGDSQLVTAGVSYTDTPTELFVRYSVNTLDFDQVVTMSNIQDSTWQSDGPLANAQAGSKVYFKVYAVGANSDTTESYKFMYEVRPFVPCAAIGSSGTGSDYIDFVSLNGVSQNSGQDYYGDFTDVVFNLNRGETYTIQIDLNYHWNPDTTAAWIDFNRDAVFSENERIVMNELNVDHESFGTFTVPLDAVLGDTLFLRARSQYWGSSPNPCGDLTGEVEDYSVVVSCQPTSASFALTACDEYTSPSGDVYTSSQVITEVLENVAGCDSTLTIDLTVVHSDAVSVDATACDSYVLPQGDVVTESGTYIATLQNASGCDSVVTVQLTILNSSTESIALSACDSYVSPSGDVYTSSQVITEVFQNAAGCDSTLVIDLTIGYSDSIFMEVTACDSYVLPQGDVVTESGLYVADFQTAQGCDSIVSVQLTILTSTSEAFEVEACGSYTSPDGTVYTSSQIIEEIISNAAGCDSTLTIDLTIYTVDTEVTQAGAVLTAQASGPDYAYQWLDCGNGFEPIPGAVEQSFTATEDGSYAVLLSTNGCVDTSSCFPVVVTGVIESNFEQQVRVYPNPTSGHLVVDLGAAYDRISWKITDEQGRLVQSQTDDSGTQVRLHIDGAAGVYFITLESGRNRLVLRVVKE